MDKQILEKFVQEGLSSYEIASKLGRGSTTIRRWLKRYNLKTIERKGPRVKPRVCECGEKRQSMFSSNGRIKGQRPCLYHICRKCHAFRTRNRYRNLKAQAVAYKGGKCSRCPYDKCTAAMHFHHKNPKLKSKEWKFIKNRTFEQQKSELDKCDLICANCHAELHYSDQGDDTHI